MEILTNLQREIIELFKDMPDSEAFCFTGGTALASFFLRHRRSYDLDFFTHVEALILPFSQKIEASLRNKALKVERLRGLHSFVELSVSSSSDSTIIHLALDSPFKLGQPFESKEIVGLKIDSLADIASNKLLALFGRAALRDFIDTYFITKEYYSKKELIEMAKQKDPGFDLYWFGVAMKMADAFPDDSAEMYLITRPCAMTELKEFFKVWRREIMEEIKSRRCYKR